MDMGVVDRFLGAIEDATIADVSVFADGVVLDATVPHRRFSLAGADAIRTEMARWYPTPGRIEDLDRIPLLGGELIEFTRRWQAAGVAYACHQLHILTLDSGRIASDKVWCGGRWPFDSREARPTNAALSSREREVAQLVAEGRTNRQIASGLCVSERTAQTHVAHILTKLALSNRAQIATWVSTHHSWGDLTP